MEHTYGCPNDFLVNIGMFEMSQDAQYSFVHKSERL